LDQGNVYGCCYNDRYDPSDDLVNNTLMLNDIPKLYSIYAQNIARFPALYGILARQLGVSVESVTKVGAGFIPVDEHENQAWVFPERNAKGKVVGIQERLDSGKKYAVKGSKRGLVYAVNLDTKQHERQQWVRVSTTHPCPLCNKPDGCLYPENEYDNPNAVICVHIESGSTKPMELGYLHIFDPARQKLLIQNYSILSPSEYPILVVEGATDVCAAYDLGFVAVGKPSAASKNKDLIELLSGHKVVILGENDAGAGKAGMEFTFTQLRGKCPECTKIMPPEGVKDLRQWVEKGLTQTEFLEYIEKIGSQVLSTDIFSSDKSLVIAQTWLGDKKTINGRISLGIYRKGFVDFNGCCYEELSDAQVHQQLYNGIGNRSYLDGSGAIKPYKLTCAKTRDILQACTSSCLISRDAPCWLIPGAHPDPRRLIVFQNGILNVDNYINGDSTLHNPTPDLFTFNALPYDFDESLESSLWIDIITDIFNGDEAKLLLLAQWFGYNLIPDMSQEKLMMFKGRTRSGKGTIANTLGAMLGDRNWCATSFASLAESFGYHPLMGKLCVIVGDTKGSKSGEESVVLMRLLNIVGRDAISVNIKGKLHLPKVNLCCRFTFAMNDFPAFRDDSGSLQERTNILTFNNSYVGREDKTLKDRLAQEASEGKLINFALRGLKSLYTDKEFVVPAESTLALNTFREIISPVLQFTSRCTEPDTEGPGVPTDYLYELWKWWCKREGLSYGHKSTLIHSLLSTTPNAMQIMEGEVGNPDQMLMGIKVTDWAETGFGKG